MVAKSYQDKMRKLTMHSECCRGGFVFHFSSNVSGIWQDGVGDDQAMDSFIPHDVVAGIVADFTTLMEPFGGGVVDVQLTLKGDRLTFVDLLVLERPDEFWWHFCLKKTRKYLSLWVECSIIYQTILLPEALLSNFYNMTSTFIQLDLPFLNLKASDQAVTGGSFLTDRDVKL